LRISSRSAGISDSVADPTIESPTLVDISSERVDTPSASESSYRSLEATYTIPTVPIVPMKVSSLPFGTNSS
jgi:hypothetical protein